MSSFPSVWRDLCWHTLRYVITFCLTWILWIIVDSLLLLLTFQWPASSSPVTSLSCFLVSSTGAILWIFVARLHWKSSFYLISSGWWSHVLSSSYLFPAKSSWLGPRFVVLCCCAWCITVGFRCEQKSMKLLRISTQSWRTSKSSESWFCQPAGHQYIGIFVSV